MKLYFDDGGSAAGFAGGGEEGNFVSDDGILDDSGSGRGFNGGCSHEEAG
jgi:hypothetical protein